MTAHAEQFTASDGRLELGRDERGRREERKRWRGVEERRRSRHRQRHETLARAGKGGKVGPGDPRAVRLGVGAQARDAAGPVKSRRDDEYDHEQREQAVKERSARLARARAAPAPGAPPCRARSWGWRPPR